MIGTPEELSKYLWSLDKEKQYEIKECKKKRSLNSNSYLWQLVTEIANEMRKSKEEVYFDMLVDYGQSFMVSVLSSIDVTGGFKYYKLAGTTMLNGKEFNHYKVYIGSSEYDTKEMSILLEGVVQEAKNLGIKTKEDLEIERLLKEWEKC